MQSPVVFYLVRYRSHATHSRQPRQVRKEATVTGSCVCSGSPVPGYFLPSLFGTILQVPKVSRFSGRNTGGMSTPRVASPRTRKRSENLEDFYTSAEPRWIF